METTRVNFRLPDDLVERADVAAAVTHKDRTEIVTEALQDYLRGIEDSDQFKEAVVECYLDDELSFEALQAFLGRQDAESVRASKAVLDQGANLADDLADLS
jgi:predicted transcriptional regulator